MDGHDDGNPNIALASRDRENGNVIGFWSETSNDHDVAIHFWLLTCDDSVAILCPGCRASLISDFLKKNSTHCHRTVLFSWVIGFHAC